MKLFLNILLISLSELKKTLLVNDTTPKMSPTLKRKHTTEPYPQEKRCKFESNQLEFSLFPNELKEMVLQNLLNSDLKNCRLLLSKHLNCIVDQRTNLWNVSTPQFCEAASRGERNICSLMLSKAKDVNPAQLNGTTPLHRASEKGQLGIVKMIAEEANKRHDMENDKSTKGVAACSTEDKYFSFACDLNLNVSDQFGRTPLYLAAMNNHADVCRYLILRGADLSIRDVNWWTLFILQS